ncbi:unnamed protein product [Cylindrotheca closterium]|uniref:Uncharacterized protein n=1 Tax=Cylindrotheca closterium TaxID=2856 RepID=A0AAD2JLS4_9STRA|nr:unnamed protein product [Cylindrotheca closterium]
MHQEDELVMEILYKRLAMDKSDRSYEMNRLFHCIANRTLEESRVRTTVSEESTTSQYISKVSFRSPRNQMIEKYYALLPQPKVDFTALTQNAKKKKANLMKEIIAQLVGPDLAQQEAFLKLSFKKFKDLILFHEEDFKWNEMHIALILCIVGSANKVIMLDRLERLLLGNTRFPPQLKVFLSKLGWKWRMRIEAEMIPLEMNGNKEVRPQLSWHLATPLRALERQVEAAFLSGNFLHSGDFSLMEDIIAVVFGADKDEIATSMLIRILNRIKGNCSAFVTTLAMYEHAAECHENMKKTFLKKGSRFLQLLLDNKCFALTVNSIDKDKGHVVQSQCIAINLFADHRQSATDERMLPRMKVKVERCKARFCSTADFKVVTSPQDFENFKNFENENEPALPVHISSVGAKDETDNDDDEKSSSTVSTFCDNATRFSDDDEAEDDASSIGEKEDDNSSDEAQSISTVSTFHDDEHDGKTDEALDFCLNDGTSRSDDDEEENLSNQNGGTTDEEEKDKLDDYNDLHDDATRADEDEENSLGQAEESLLGMKCIGLKLDEEWKNGSKRLWLQLVYNDDNKYYGYRIFLNSNPDVDGNGQCRLLVAGFFEKPIHRRDSMDDELIDCGFKQVVGFASCDKKDSWATMGMMDSANARSNCICCIQSQSTYKTNFPDWMVEYAQNNGIENGLLAAKVEAGWKYCPLRCREHSNPIMFQKLQDDTNNGNNTYSEDQLRGIRERHGCVVNEPLLDIHPSKQTFGGLHNGAGLENHIKNNTDMRLGHIDALKSAGTTTWLEKMDGVKVQCKHEKANTKRRLKALKKKIDNLQSGINSAKIIIERAEDPHRRFASTSDACVQNVRAELAILLSEKEPLDGEYGENLRLHMGADVLPKLIERYLSTKKPKGPAQWAFRKAIELAGPKFNPQFGGMDLSHAHGLLMLEKFSEITKMVGGGGYRPGEEKHQMVAQAMGESQEITTPMFTMNTLLKSQQKWDEDKIDELKRNCFMMFFKWLKYFPKQGVFPKLHDVAWHIPQFVTRNWMYGILSEESMESRHQEHQKLLSILSFMPNTKLRNDVFTSRLQVYQLPEFEKEKATLTAKTTKKKRGKYNIKPKNNSLPILQTELILDGVNIRINKDMSIEPSWLEVYNMVARGIVPSSWEKNI